MGAGRFRRLQPHPDFQSAENLPPLGGSRSIGSPTLPLSREARATIVRGPSRLERHVSARYSCSRPPTAGRLRHDRIPAAAGSPDRSPAPRCVERHGAQADASRPRRPPVPLAATPTPPNSTAPRTAAARSLARRRVESPVPMPFAFFAFVFVLFEFLLTTPNQPRAVRCHKARRLHLDVRPRLARLQRAAPVPLECPARRNTCCNELSSPGR